MNGNGAAGSLEGFVYITMNSIAQTCVTFVGANYGAHKTKNIDKSILYSSLLIFTLGFVLGVVILMFSEPLLGLYVDNNIDLKYGQERLQIILLTYFLCGLMDVFALSLRALGYSLVPTIVSLLGVCGIRIAWIYLVFSIPEYHNLNSLAYSYPISWLLTGAIHFVFLMLVKRKVYKKIA